MLIVSNLAPVLRVLFMLLFGENWLLFLLFSSRPNKSFSFDLFVWPPEVELAAASFAAVVLLVFCDDAALDSFLVPGLSSSEEPSKSAIAKGSKP
jgi:hypothetical protein